MRDEQMHGVCSMFEQVSSDFRAILRDLDVDLRESVGIWDVKKQPINRLLLEYLLQYLPDSGTRTPGSLTRSYELAC